ncbi:hypothetical protein ACOSP7_028949 [Xanthoceras sorbifolium]
MNKETNQMTQLSPLHPSDSSPPLALEPTKSDIHHDQQHSKDEQLQTQQNPSSKPYQHFSQSNEGKETQSSSCSHQTFQPVNEEKLAAEDSDGRERLKRHRSEVAGRVWIPDIWGQEKMLKDWIDCSAFDASLASSNILSARAALAQEGRRARSGGLRIENRC